MASASRAIVADDGFEDGRLTVALARGDREALASLYDRHAPCLLALGMRMLGDRALAEQVLEDVFLEAWHSARAIDPGRHSLRAWLIARMRERALARRPQGGGGPERSRVDPAIAGLEPELAAVIELAYFEGLSCEQMAGRLGIPAPQVRARLAFALQVLRRNQSAATGET
jgi:RNA polymerase sigma-70 factor, ECF subfamily